MLFTCILDLDEFNSLAFFTTCTFLLIISIISHAEIWWEKGSRKQQYHQGLILQLGQVVYTFDFMYDDS